MWLRALFKRLFWVNGIAQIHLYVATLFLEGIDEFVESFN
jgi:hypothetical protein